jgi:hypothetical protein
MQKVKKFAKMLKIYGRLVHSGINLMGIVEACHEKVYGKC